MPSAAFESASTGVAIRRDRYQARPGGHEQPDAERDQEQLEEREPALGQIRLLSRDHERAEALARRARAAAPTARKVLSSPGGVNSKVLTCFAVEQRLPFVLDLGAGQLAQAGAVPEEDGRADVVEAGPGRLLELRPVEVRCRPALVDRAESPAARTAARARAPRASARRATASGRDPGTAGPRSRS